MSDIIVGGIRLDTDVLPAQIIGFFEEASEAFNERLAQFPPPSDVGPEELNLAEVMFSAGFVAACRKRAGLPVFEPDPSAQR